MLRTEPLKLSTFAGNARERAYSGLRLVIPAWMPESSHKDVNPGVAIKPFSNAYATDMSPSLALDSGIHAGMTAMEP